jgi:drug/metabolite transporter (DMT)-like permease
VSSPTVARPAVYLVAAATVTVLGSNWPIMAAGVDLVPPLWLAAIRLGGAALLVAAVMLAQGRLRRPVSADRPIVLSVGLVRLSLVTAFVFAALRVVPPGRSSILVYTGALWAAPLAALTLHERLTGLRVVGLALGCVGLVLLLEPSSFDWGDPRVLTGTAMLLVAAVANASTTVHVRGHRWIGSPIELMPWQLGLGAIPIVVVAVFVEGAPSIAWTWTTVAIVAYQIVLASAFALWGLLTVGRSLPAITANLTVMAVPVVGLVTSVAFTDEQLTPSVVASLVLILAGVGAGLLSDRLRPDEPLPPAD